MIRNQLFKINSVNKKLKPRIETQNSKIRNLTTNSIFYVHNSKSLVEKYGYYCLRSLFFFIFVQEYPINPKAVSLGELYGEFDLATNEWSDGVLSSVMRLTCSGINSLTKIKILALNGMQSLEFLATPL